MGTFENFVSKAKNVADIAGKKTGDMMEVTKLRISVSDAETKLSHEFAQLGERVYRAAKEQTDVTEYVHDKSVKIDAVYEEIAGLKAKIAKLKKEKKCPECGFINPEGANFCIKCGARL